LIKLFTELSIELSTELSIELSTELSTELLIKLSTELLIELFTELFTQLSSHLTTCSNINSSLYLLMKTANRTAIHVISNFDFEFYKVDVSEFQVFIFFLLFLLSRTATIKISIYFHKTLYFNNVN